MTHYCYVVVCSEGTARLIAFEPDVVWGAGWQDKKEELVQEWEALNNRGCAVLGRLLENGWRPVRETPMAPGWQKTSSDHSYSLVLLEKDQ